MCKIIHLVFFFLLEFGVVIILSVYVKYNIRIIKSKVNMDKSMYSFFNIKT
jgi:hypothetical protein